MQSLYLLVTMSAFLVTSVTGDVAVTFHVPTGKLNLISEQFEQLRVCLCTSSHAGCEFNALQTLVTPTILSGSSTQYLNVYTCTFPASGINCTRMKQQGHRSAANQLSDKSFSFNNTNTGSCDIDCVDAIWDDNFTLHTDIVTAELCPAKQQPNPHNMTNTTIIIAAVVVSILLIVIISVVIIICVRNKNKPQLKNTALYTVNPETCNYPEVDKGNGLYAVSSEASWPRDLDKEQEPLYYEVDKDKPDPLGVRDSILSESNSFYSKLHTKADKPANTYDVLPRRDSQF